MQLELSYHNTNKERGQELSLSEDKAKHQEEIILQFFKNCPPYWSYSADKIWTICFDKSILLTSCRRAITNLTKSGKLVKSEQMVKGFTENKYIHGK